MGADVEWGDAIDAWSGLAQEAMAQQRRVRDGIANLVHDIGPALHVPDAVSR